MTAEIHVLEMPLPFRMGMVNCYLIRAGEGFVLIDTGPSACRKKLAEALETAGCGPGRLRLTLITHGDFDHSGNAAYLRRTYGGKIAMHPADREMAERADMFVNRKRPNFLIRGLVPILFRFGKEERFGPDLLIREGDVLGEYGLAGKVVSIPGHSRGSIGVLLEGGDLFCGDLLENMSQPAFSSMMDDPEAGETSLRRLESMGVGMVYPGHGRPFALKDFG